MTSTRQNVSVGALLLVAVGVTLLLQTTDVVNARIWADLIRLWPLTLVLAGVHMIIGERLPYIAAAVTVVFLAAAIAGAAFMNNRDVGEVIGNSGPSSSVSAEDQIDLTVAFGGSDRRVTAQSFDSGEVTAVFGSAKLDLREALLDSTGARLELAAVFGSVEVIVPKRWNLTLEDTAQVFGSVSDQRGSKEYLPGSPRLEVEATGVFGSVVAKD